jgi:hypothetical protein
MRNTVQSVHPKNGLPFGVVLALGAVFAILAVTTAIPAHANPGVTSTCDPTNPTCTLVSMTPGSTVTIKYDHAWDALECSAANAVAGNCTLCVWTSDNILDVTHSCAAGGSTGNNGFTFSGDALHHTILVPIGTAGTHVSSLVVTAPSVSAIGGVTVNICLTNPGTLVCSTSTAGTSSAISTQLTVTNVPEFSTSVVFVSVLGLAGLALLKRKALPTR